MASHHRSSSCSHDYFVKKRRRHAACCCPSSCPSSRDSSCSSLSCLKECGKNECMLVRQFLDFNDTGAVYLNRVIPVPCCQEIDGLAGSKNRLGMKFQEMKPPFFVEVAREHPKCKDRHSSKHSSRSCSCSLCKSHVSKSTKH